MGDRAHLGREGDLRELEPGCKAKQPSPCELGCLLIVVSISA
jgi:hypothetical protein